MIKPNDQAARLHTHTHTPERKGVDGMREPIKTTPEELAELLALCHENIRIADMTDARHIYDQYITKYGENRDPDYTAVAALGTLYRTGYILGQRSERTRRAAHVKPFTGGEQQAFENGLKLGAMLNEYMSAGGSISKLLELINQVDKAKKLKGGAAHGV